jgi:hypothetical protein
MDVKDRIHCKTGGRVPGQAGSVPGQSTTTNDADAGWRRVMLERRWARKLDEVMALTAVCEGTSAAGDDMPKGAATLPARRLHERAAAAYEELGNLADAIARIDDWLASKPAARSG